MMYSDSPLPQPYAYSGACRWINLPREVGAQNADLLSVNRFYREVVIGQPEHRDKASWVRWLDEEQLVIVNLPTPDDLSDVAFLSGLSLFYDRLDIGRRSVPQWVESRLHSFDGYLIWNDEGKPRQFLFAETDIIDEFEDADRWLGDFMKYHEHPWKQRPQAKVIMRLIYLALARDIKQLKPSVMVRRVEFRDS